MRSVVKHKFLRGKQVKGKAKAHIKYLEHRDGPDRPEGGRKFFDAKEDGISGKDIRAEIDENNPTLVHKLILSPGLDNVDMKAYTREVMQQLERHKGIELNWKAVDHQNTDHGHGHVLLYAHEGQQVRFNKSDYTLIKQAGDRYLEREHQLERYLPDRQLDRVLKGPDYDREGDKTYQGLIDDVMAKPKQVDLDLDEAERKKKTEREAQDIDEHRKLDSDLNKVYQSKDERTRGKGKEQYVQESRGRLTEFHTDYGFNTDLQLLEEEKAKYPDRADEINERIENLKNEHLEHKQNIKPWREFDVLIGYDLDEIAKRDEPDRSAQLLPAPEPLELEKKDERNEPDNTLVPDDSRESLEPNHPDLESKNEHDLSSGAKDPHLSKDDQDIYMASFEDFDYSIDDDQDETGISGTRTKDKDKRDGGKGGSSDLGLGDDSETDSDQSAVPDATTVHLQQEFFENSEPEREEPEIDDGFDRGLR